MKKMSPIMSWQNNWGTAPIFEWLLIRFDLDYLRR